MDDDTWLVWPLWLAAAIVFPAACSLNALRKADTNECQCDTTVVNAQTEGSASDASSSLDMPLIIAVAVLAVLLVITCFCLCQIRNWALGQIHDLEAQVPKSRVEMTQS